MPDAPDAPEPAPPAPPAPGVSESEEYSELDLFASSDDYDSFYDGSDPDDYDSLYDGSDADDYGSDADQFITARDPTEQFQTLPGEPRITLTAEEKDAADMMIQGGVTIARTAFVMQQKYPRLRQLTKGKLEEKLRPIWRTYLGLAARGGKGDWHTAMVYLSDPTRLYTGLGSGCVLRLKGPYSTCVNGCSGVDWTFGEPSPDVLKCLACPGRAAQDSHEPRIVKKRAHMSSGTWIEGNKPIECKPFELVWATHEMISALVKYGNGSIQFLDATYGCTNGKHWTHALSVVDEHGTPIVAAWFVTSLQKIETLKACLTPVFLAAKEIDPSFRPALFMCDNDMAERNAIKTVCAELFAAEVEVLRCSVHVVRAIMANARGKVPKRTRGAGAGRDAFSFGAQRTQRSLLDAFNIAPDDIPGASAEAMQHLRSICVLHAFHAAVRQSETELGSTVADYLATWHDKLHEINPCLLPGVARFGHTTNNIAESIFSSFKQIFIKSTAVHARHVIALVKAFETRDRLVFAPDRARKLAGYVNNVRAAKIVDDSLKQAATMAATALENGTFIVIETPTPEQIEERRAQLQRGIELIEKSKADGVDARHVDQATAEQTRAAQAEVKRAETSMAKWNRKIDALQETTAAAEAAAAKAAAAEVATAQAAHKRSTRNDGRGPGGDAARKVATAAKQEAAKLRRHVERLQADLAKAQAAERNAQHDAAAAAAMEAEAITREHAAREKTIASYDDEIKTLQNAIPEIGKPLKYAVVLRRDAATCANSATGAPCWVASQHPGKVCAHVAAAMLKKGIAEDTIAASFGKLFGSQIGGFAGMAGFL